MKVGDLVKLSIRHPRRNKVTGVIVDNLTDGYKRHSLGVLWSNTSSSVRDNRISWHSPYELELINV